jgi:hypothetical protein
MVAYNPVDRKRNIYNIGTSLHLIYLLRTLRANITWAVYLQMVTKCPANVGTYSLACAPGQRSPGKVVMLDQTRSSGQYSGG